MPVPLRPVAVAAATLILSGAAAAQAPSWTVDHDESTLGFIASQGGSPFEGEFGRFEADIDFDPQDLASSRAVVTIDVSSARTGSSDRDQALPTDPWFDAGSFPEARFETTGFRHLGGNEYEAEAELTIKDITRPVTLPFTLVIEGERADADGRLTLSRVDYDVGTGEWAGSGVVAHDVVVVVALTAYREDA